MREEQGDIGFVFGFEEVVLADDAVVDACASRQLSEEVGIVLLPLASEEDVVMSSDVKEVF